MKLNQLIPFFALAFSSICIQSQTISSKIVDGKTKIPIPYATIQFGKNQGVISNEEGKFSFAIDSTTQKLDSIYITSLGYKKTGFTYENLLDSIIYIQPKAIELGGVYVFNKNLSVEEIVEKMEENLEQNHKNSFLKKRFFLRQSFTDLMRKVDVEFIKSTIAELDEELIDSTLSVIPRKSSYYTETLGDLYTSSTDNNSNKLEIIKAAELYNKANEISGEAIQERFNKILEQNVKKDSYLKIKSGWFGTKIQVDSIIENESAEDAETEEKAPEKTNFLPNRKHALKIMHDRMFIKKSNLDVIRKLSKYSFSLKGYTEIENAGVYILSFKPKRRADFEGTLFVNVEDFAIMRIDYGNVKSLKKVKLLGFSYNHHTYKGATVFTKDPAGSYTVKFATFEGGSSFGVKRPLKIIEKNKHVKGRRKQNELKLELDIAGNNYYKYELVVYDITKSDANTLKALTEEKNVKPQYLPSYDPNFWKGYTIMEPNQAIKEFTISETN